MLAASLLAMSLSGDTSVDRLKATVTHLASYHTRNTSSPELLQAANWMADQYRQIPGLQVELMPYHISKSRRIPEDKEVVQVLARLPGKDDRILLVGGHLDSINLRGDVFTGRAPGANDDASGAALALEIARVMSRRKWQHTLVFVAFTGEEQGLLGSTALAQRAAKEGWKIDAVLSNDMVGNSRTNDGQHDSRHVRVFSDSPDASGKNPQRSRELARFIEWQARERGTSNRVRLVLRRDRYGRGGDHTPFNENGFNAVRFTDVFEEYARQHTDQDLPQFVDWGYLARNAQVNMVALESLADAGPPPTELKLDLRQSHDTTLTWHATAGTSYTVYWRETASAVWEQSRKVGATDQVTLKGISKDDYFFAVGAEGGIPVPL
jgi:Zn-dependent M28 family amino/carboxypeptidase